MTVSDWIVIAVGVPLWAWFFRQFFSRDGFGYFDRETKLCWGCQRHYLIPGCPVHDERRRNGEAMSATERAEAS